MKRLKLLGGALLALSLTLTVVGIAFAQQQTVSVTLNPMAGSGVSGTATLTAMGAQTQVSLNVMGFAPNTTHPTHIHTGTCASPGGVQFPLPDLMADGAGRATGTGTVNAALSSLTDGNHLVMTHTAGPGVACGDIPRAAAVAPPAAAPAPAAPAPAPAAPAAPAPAPAPAAPPAAAPAPTGGLAALAAAAALGALGLFALGGGLLLRRR